MDKTISVLDATGHKGLSPKDCSESATLENAVMTGIVDSNILDIHNAAEKHRQADALKVTKLFSFLYYATVMCVILTMAPVILADTLEEKIQCFEISKCQTLVIFEGNDSFHFKDNFIEITFSDAYNPVRDAEFHLTDRTKRETESQISVRHGVLEYPQIEVQRSLVHQASFYNL